MLAGIAPVTSKQETTQYQELTEKYCWRRYRTAEIIAAKVELSEVGESPDARWDLAWGTHNKRRHVLFL